MRNSASRTLHLPRICACLFVVYRSDYYQSTEKALTPALQHNKAIYAVLYKVVLYLHRILKLDRHTGATC
jgi:hypothetical protein